ncbi:helix-turn-helix domain-containing protein [Krasilnikovia sp. MM14-A1259]|uniref:helix-turn-helix domain-containing protein n=1 Tax=Krasilnikovia sp. MM14-A1259 TaxID=3373539 RepID=UPI003803216F
MLVSSSSSAQQARDALGLRLREIRLEAGLTASALAALMGRHHAKVSRIEHGSAAPSEADIREWCRHCRIPEQIPDLLASLRAVEGMWIEWRRMEVAGLRHAQEAVWPLYERTRQFRVYTPNLLPGVLQTRGYTTAVLEAIRRRRSVPDDVEDAVAVRMERKRILRDTRHRFAILIEEAALAAGVGGAEVMIGQLGHLIEVSAAPTVSLGILPARPDRDDAWPVEGFWIFDDEQVQVELVSGHLTVTQPREIAMYAQVFAELSAAALYGFAARSRITAAIDAIGA